MRSRLISALMVIIIFGLTPASPLEAAGKHHFHGYYSGHTSQGGVISFVVAHGKVSQLFARMIDACPTGKWYVTFTPSTVSVTARGDWFRRTPGKFHAVIHGHVSGGSATGTIDDLSRNNADQTCRGHVSFQAKRGSPLHISSATVGQRGTDVLLRLTLPAEVSGNEIVPRTKLALLVYGSNTGCRKTYRAADALARSAQSYGFTGLISDAYITADYGFALFKSYKRGTFTFDVSTNTLLRAPSGTSPFSTVCIMLYSGKPGTLTPSRNASLARTHGPLVRGPGIPNTQP